MESDKKKIEDVLKKAEELAKVMAHVEQLLQGMPYHDRISLLSTALMKNIVQQHETSIEVVADMANIFATMVTSYRLMNEMDDDDEDEDDEDQRDMRQ